VKVLQSRTESIGLRAEKELYLPIRIDGSDKVSIKYNVPESVKAPVKKGDKIGSVTISITGFGQWEIDLVSDSEAKENTYKSNLDNLIKKFLWRN
jgi:D-alanyl-D-alanine carboxypeptidase (penicillin-binding protein 5/6)